MKEYKQKKIYLSTGDIELLEKLLRPLKEYENRFNCDWSIKEDIKSLTILIKDLKEDIVG